MSLVIAVRDGDRVFFAADTQTTKGKRKRCNVSETNLKIARMPNGILLGHAGLVRNANVLSTHNDWFENIGEGDLTKEILVKDIIPKLINEMIERDYLDKEEKDYPKMQGSFLIAQGNQLYHIKSNFSVWRIHDFAMIGSGSDSSNAVLFSADEGKTIKEKMLLSLKQAAYFDTAVDKPFVFIDTHDLQYEIMEEEQC